MPSLQALKILLVTVAISALAGCKFEVVAVEGGNIVSDTGTRNCEEGSNCVFEVTTLPFDETFTAIPKPGYEFVEWQRGAKFSCGAQATPSCDVDIADDAGGAAVMALFDTGYIMPIYKFVGIDTDGDGVKDHLDDDDDDDGILDDVDSCPLEGPDYDGFGCPGLNIADTVTANGNEWAQVDLFTNLSWNDINAVCPDGVCAGMLNGYNMTGWTWASANDVVSLFNFYGINPPLAVSEQRSELNSIWALAFYSAGWRATYIYEPTGLYPPYPKVYVTFGWPRTQVCVPECEAYRATMTRDSGSYSSDTDKVSMYYTVALSFADDRYGAWFYRPPE